MTSSAIGCNAPWKLDIEVITQSTPTANTRVILTTPAQNSYTYTYSDSKSETAALISKSIKTLFDEHRDLFPPDLYNNITESQEFHNRDLTQEFEKHHPNCIYRVETDYITLRNTAANEYSREKFACGTTKYFSDNATFFEQIKGAVLMVDRLHNDILGAPNLSPHQKRLISQNKEAMLQIAFGVIPKTCLGRHDLALQLGLKAQLFSSLNQDVSHVYIGDIRFRCLIEYCTRLLIGTLGIYQLFSEEYASELVACFKNTPCLKIEVGAGRGLQAVALEQQGMEFSCVTDLFPPAHTWQGINVAELDVEEVLKRDYNGQQVLLFAAAPDPSLIMKLVNFEKEALVFLSNSTQIGEPFTHHNLQRQRLHFKHLPKEWPISFTGLIALNMSKKAFSAILKTIPDQFKQAKPDF